MIDRAAVVEASVATIGADQAFAGQPLRVTLRYDSNQPDAPTTLVAKLPATALPMRRALSGLGWYETEIRFYEEIAPNFGTRTPRRYFTAMEPDDLNYVLLMEDVTSGTVGNQIAGASLHQAEIAIDELARIHAAWWNDRRLDDLHAADASLRIPRKPCRATILMKIRLTSAPSEVRDRTVLVLTCSLSCEGTAMR